MPSSDTAPPLRILAISGSTRAASTNTAMLDAMRGAAPVGTELCLFTGIGDLPVFSPDREGAETPAPVQAFIAAIDAADGLIISTPEYVHAIPGGLKNAIDWLVSDPAIVAKPVVLVHASHRGDDMLAALRLVLRTVSERFNEALFLRVPLIGKTPHEVRQHMTQPAMIAQTEDFLRRVAAFIRAAHPGPDQAITA